MIPIMDQLSEFLLGHFVVFGIDLQYWMVVFIGFFILWALFLFLKRPSK
jgi:hypothetical protein